MFVQIQVCNFGSFLCLFGFAENAISGDFTSNIVHASVVRIHFCHGCREFFVIFFQISFFNHFLYVLGKPINFIKRESSKVRSSSQIVCWSVLLLFLDSSSVRRRVPGGGSSVKEQGGIHRLHNMKMMITTHGMVTQLNRCNLKWSKNPECNYQDKNYSGMDFSKLCHLVKQISAISCRFLNV